MVGENFVILVGKITYPNFKELDNNNYMFKAKLAIPSPDGEGYQYVKIGAWGGLAEDLGILSEGTYVRIHGHIEESSYKAECKQCKWPEKKFWTEVMVDNFVIMEGDN